MLAVRNLEAGYGSSRVVQGVSLDLAAGEITALLGANGAGKTTTLRAISGAVRRFGGEVLLAGEPLPSRPELVAARGVAHVPQGRLVFPGLTVSENLIAVTQHLGRREARAGLTETFALLPTLDRLSDRRAGLLSGGEQQTLAIGRAIVARARVVMIDELSLGLAPKTANGFAGVLRALADRGTALLVVEQHTHLARRVASRMLVMSKGRLVFEGTAGSATDGELERLYLGTGAARPAIDGAGARPSQPPDSSGPAVR